jgi:protease-4
MIAAQCDEIIASPSASVGSIGVILQVMDASKALDKLGLEFTVVTSGKYKDAGSPYRALTAEELALLRTDMDLVYEQFIKVVAEGRKMPVEQVRKLATGWAWPGVKAKELGLVDTIGNYSDALRVAAKRGKITGQPRIETYEPDPFEQLLDQLSSVRRQLEALGGGAVPRQARPTMR